jgi:esterase/lipase
VKTLATGMSSRWRRWLTGLVAALALLALGFSLGPRLAFGPDAPTQRPAPPAQLAELDDWLRRSEQAQPGIRAGTEKTVHWAAQPGQRTLWSVVYIHGFGASRLETAPLAEQVAQGLGANLFETRLTGHGRDGQAMAQARAQDWLADTLEAARIGHMLGERMLIISCSTGSTLASWLGLQPQGQQVAAQVFISPNFGPKDARSEWLLGPWGEQIAYAVAGQSYGQVSENPRERQGWTAPYPTRAIFPMMTLVDKVRRSPLEQFSTPLLVFYSAADQRVEPAHTLAAFARIGSPHKTLQRVDDSDSRSQHVLAGDILAPKTTAALVARVLQWVQALPQAKP